MTTVALIMAGGAGTRMRVSVRHEEKALVPVRGVPLIERNLFALVGAGLKHIVVAMPSRSTALERWYLERGALLSRALDVRLERIDEPHALGNMGAAFYLRERCRDVIVVFADNLTALGLRDLLSFHTSCGAALTLATHHQRLRVPFGVVRVEGDLVLGCEEKPQITATVCSGLYVLGPQALAAMEPGAAVGATGLISKLLGSGAPVRSFQHDAPWIDVNDGAAVDHAEDLVGAHRALECWSTNPEQSVALGLFHGKNDQIIRMRGGSLPALTLQTNEDPVEAWRAFLAELGAEMGGASESATFDDVQLEGARHVVRYHVVQATGVTFPMDASRVAPCSLGRAVVRALTYATSNLATAPFLPLDLALSDEEG